MAVFLSPGVFINEIDLSAFASDGADVVPAFVGTAQKGPINKPVLITSAQQFVETFGEPFADSYLGYAVLAFLEQGNRCWVNRVGVICEDGQDTALSDVCIDMSGSKGQGWGRIALFSGIDYGKICTKVISAESPLVFHAASTTTPLFTDVDVSSFGEPDAVLALSGTYDDAIDDSFIVVITGAPTSSVMEGATYEVIRNSDGETISSGTLTEASAGVTDPFAIGTGDNSTGLTGIITITNSSPVEVGDYFVFNAVPDNRSFAFRVEGDPAGTYAMAAGSYTDPDDFVTDFNSLAGSGEGYVAVAQDDGSVCIQTDAAGEWIQLVVGEAFALELGVQLWAYDIPRSHIVGSDDGPYNINSTNNRVKIRVVGQTEVKTTEITVTSSTTHTAGSVAAELDVGGTIEGTRYFESFALRISDDSFVPVIMTTTLNNTDNLRLLASSSNLKTLRFAQTMGIPFPYGHDYVGFSDSRVILPDTGVIDTETPLSCELDAGSSDCLADTAYYTNIVGFLVAESPGSWIDDYKAALEVYNNTNGRFTLKLFDGSNALVSRIDDISFDSRETRYIGNILNEGTTIGGTSGDKFLRWEARPAFLNNDVSDTATFEVRNPSTFASASFTGGQNGIPTDATYSSEVDAAILGNEFDASGIFAFTNTDVFDIDMLLTPGVSTGAVIGQALQLCESRGDCIYLVDPPFGLKAQQVIDWHNGILDSSVTAAINSSYGALYWSWVKIFDQFSREEIFIPPCGPVAAVYARTARVAEVWFAPAGLNRGKLTTALDVEVNPTQGERDALYSFGNAVNPITKFPQDGLVVFGQRTLQRADTALNRVNVRMLLNYIKKRAVRLLRNFVFEQNDRFTRATVVANVEPFLRDIAARRGLTGWKVVCDETNNTPQRIDNHELHVSIFIRPTRSAEFINVNLVVLRTEQSFSAEEVLVAGGVQLETQ